MRWLLPKSLNGFLLLGLGVIAVPLLVAILHATMQMRRLTERQPAPGARERTDHAPVAEHVRADRLAGARRRASTRCSASRKLLERLRRCTTRISPPPSPQLRQQLRNADIARGARAHGHVARQRVGPEPACTAAPASDPSPGAARLRPLGQPGRAGGGRIINKQIDAELASLRAQTESARSAAVLGVRPAGATGAGRDPELCARRQPADAPGRSRDQRARRRQLRARDHVSAVPSTCSASASSSNGCAAACSSWRRIATASCATCRTSSRRRSPTSAKAPSC